MPILNESEALLSSLYQNQWEGFQSNWEHLLEIAEWMRITYQDVKEGQINPKFLNSLSVNFNQEKLQKLATVIKNELDSHSIEITNVVDVLKLDSTMTFAGKGTLLTQSFLRQLKLISVWYREIDSIQDIIAYNHQVDRMRELNMGTLLPIVSTWKDAGEFLSQFLEHTWYESLIQEAFKTRPILQKFNREIQEQRIEDFCDLDQKLMDQNKVHLAQQHWENLPSHDAGGQLGILNKQFHLKRKHLPIRKLMQQAGNAIQAIKPVFMMSPLSISMFIPPNSVQFDLVVFDEASQVKPVESFGALLRGKQAVVVGDSRQLPPTSFFNQIADIDEETETQSADLESILTLFLAQNAPERTLRWHYRSRHESLITVSNYEFYDNKLIVLPNPDATKRDLGLVLRHLPHTYYDRGKSRTNPKEAMAVAEAVMMHARQYPTRSLGVAAFSSSQMEAIQLRLEKLRQEEPDCEHFFSQHPEEPFFIKNLENVQGDERDVIFISVGYGRDANGHLTMSFGPLNKEGGERRLNVLITRAKLRCEVFTNLTAEDIRLSATSARGLVAFKQFLNYAKTGNLDMPIPADREPDSPFEIAVADSLRHAGYDVTHQVGAAGFYIDLAIIDKEQPGRYLLGIECDGATYHSSRSARDRDKLRQEVLEGLGWKIHRIWSTDWFQHPKRELRRVVEAIESAKSTPRTSRIIKKDIPLIHRHEEKSPSRSKPTVNYNMASLQIPNYQFRNIELHEVSSDTLNQWVEKIVEIESPVHIDEVIRRIGNAYGVKRIGNRIRTTISSAIAKSAQLGNIKQNGQFLWYKSMNKPNNFRKRDELPKASRDIALIAPEEIEVAIENIINDSYGISQDDIPTFVSNAFGFKRSNKATREHIALITNAMLKQGKLQNKNGFLVSDDG